ncbi:MAG: GFA family protein [Erythrobacter sp.]
MKATGGCQCGAVRYELTGEITGHALCHCADCRASSGAPAMAWLMMPEDSFTLTKGELTDYNSSGNAHRKFCGTCGTGIAYTNAEHLPGLIDVQSATLDENNSNAPGVQIQTSDRLFYMKNLGDIPAFEGFPE